MPRLLLLIALCGLWLNAPVLADTTANPEERAAEPAATPADCECTEEHDSGYQRAFAEGTPNLFSPVAVAPDHLSLFYAHNFFSASFPRSSNPAFWLRYSPLTNLQLDALVSLRERPAEGELGLGYQVFSENAGHWLNLMPRLSYNSRGNLLGFELGASKQLLPELWQVGLDARFLSTGKPDSFDRPLGAVGFNTLIRVWKHWHLFGDVVVPLDAEILQKRSVIWTTGLKKVIPDTPHILTLYAGNAQEQSLSGRTLSPGNVLADIFKVGFIFSIDIDHLSRLPARLF